MSLKDVYKNADKDSNYVKISDGGSVEGKLLDVTESTGNFGKQVNYKLEIDDTEKTFSSGSKRLLRAMREAEIEEGDTIKISAEGEGMERTYEVEKVNDSE